MIGRTVGINFIRIDGRIATNGRHSRVTQPDRRTVLTTLAAALLLSAAAPAFAQSYEQALAQYNAARAPYEEAASAYWDDIADKRRLAIWLKPEDLVQLIQIGFEHRDIKFEIFYGCSNNIDAGWDNSNAQRYGYHPIGKADDYRDQAMAAQAKLAPDPVGDKLQGGTFSSAEYDAKS